MKKCKVCGRECNKLTNGMCNKHYRQFKKYGEAIDNNPRTIKDPNEIIEYEDYAEIILYNLNCEEVARALIDLEDIDKIKDYKWRVNDQGYALTDIKGSTKKIRLHRLIMNCPEDKVVDHINHNTLDNRKSNLRICTLQQNNKNQKKKTNNKSGVIGVSWDNSRGKWCAQIMHNHKHIHLGRFDTIEEAIEARKQAEITYYGEYRNTNEDVS